MRAACALLLVPTLITLAPVAPAAANDLPPAAHAYTAQPDRTPASPALAAIGRATDAAPDPAVLSWTRSYARDFVAYVRDTRARPAVTAKQRHCLATAIYFEARGEPERGQVAVAQVILNRVADPAYPDTICDVVYQNRDWRNRCQFSFACDGKPEKITEKHAWAQAVEVARAVSLGRAEVTALAGATHYHASYVSPRWAPRLKRLARIGQHIFYRS
ncbi:cell wall hydrolase [Devosia sp.]|uniref:cell wall hydrolase n=1 Tax=Devosia sp. TaxID=1871048 RepID=UPI002F045880